MMVVDPELDVYYPQAKKLCMTCGEQFREIRGTTFVQLQSTRDHESTTRKAVGVNTYQERVVDFHRMFIKKTTNGGLPTG